MSTTIDRIFDAFEQGRISRREVLGAIASFVALGGSGACAGPANGDSKATAPSDAPAPDYSHLVTRREAGDGRAHLNHVNLRVADIERSHTYYERFFGLGIITTPTYNALDCGGGTFISLQTKSLIDLEDFRTGPGAVEWAKTPDQPSGIIEHFCLEVDDFDLEQTKAALEAAGHEAVEVHGNLLTSDPDGILVQVVDSEETFLHEA